MQVAVTAVLVHTQYCEYGSPMEPACGATDATVRPELGGSVWVIEITPAGASSPVLVTRTVRVSSPLVSPCVKAVGDCRVVRLTMGEGGCTVSELLGSLLPWSLVA